MPLLTLTVAAAPDASLTRKVAELLFDRTSKILGKNPALTAIVVRYNEPEQWFIDRASLATQARTSFAFDIKITDGTNTKEEKARYISSVYEGLTAVLADHGLGVAHEISYITIDDFRADAWGFGGRTQENRFIRGRDADLSAVAEPELVGSSARR